MKRKSLELLLAVLILGVLTVYFTYPLSFRLSDHLINLRDPLLNTYIIGHGVKALTSNPLSYFDAGMYYPYETTIAFSEHLFAQTIIAAPIILLTGNQVLAHNLVHFLAYFLSGLGVFLLVRELTGNGPASLIAGVVFAFTNMRFIYIANIQIQWIAPLPFVVLFLVRFFRHGGAIHLALFSISLTMQVLASVYYAAFSYLFVGLFVLLAALLRMKGTGLKNIAKVFACMLGIFLITLPFHLPYVLVHLRHQVGMTLERAAYHQASPVSYLTMPRTNKSFLTPLLNNLFQEWREGLFPGVIALALCGIAVFAYRKDQTKPAIHAVWLWLWRLAAGAYALIILLGAITAGLPGSLGEASSWVAGLTQPFIVAPFLVLVGVFLAGRRNKNEDQENGRRLVVLYGSSALILLVISFGPFAEIGDVEMGAGIYSILFYLLPPLRAIRYVNRFAILVLFCVAVLAGLGAAALMRRFKRVWISVAFAGACILFMAYEYATVPVLNQPVPQEMPEVYQWLARQEGRFAIMEIPLPREGPHESIRMYWSLRHGKDLVWGYSGFSPRLQMALAAAVGHLPAPNALDYVRRVGIKYLLVHGSEPGGRYQKLAGALKRYTRYLKFVGRFGGTSVFENRNYMAGKTEVRIFRTRELEGARVSFKAKAAKWDRDLVPSLKVYLDNALVAEFTLFKKWRSYSLEVSNLSGFSDLRSLKFAYSYKPKKKISNAVPGWRDKLPVDVDLRSVYRQSGLASQLFTHAAINGLTEKELSSGYTLFSINPKSGEIEKRAAFNVRRTAGSAQSLAEFVGSIPEGRFVVGITCYKSGALLSDAALAALRSLGCAEAEKIKTGKAMSHVFIGRKGAKPSTALEKTGNKEVTLKVGRDQQKLGFIIQDLKVEKDNSTK